MSAASVFGKVAVLMGGHVEGRSRGPACGDATAEACISAAVYPER